MNTKNKIEKKLKEYFNVHTLQIIDESHKHINHKKDTQGGHFKLLIISEDFEIKIICIDQKNAPIIDRRSP